MTSATHKRAISLNRFKSILVEAALLTLAWLAKIEANGNGKWQNG
jgi:hypothetical protein